MLRKWFKRVIVLGFLAMSFSAGYRIGRIPREQRLRWAGGVLRRWTRRLLTQPSNAPVMAELSVIRTQNDRILGQNQSIYRQNDRILGILVRQFADRPAAESHAHI